MDDDDDDETGSRYVQRPNRTEAMLDLRRPGPGPVLTLVVVVVVVVVVAQLWCLAGRCADIEDAIDGETDDELLPSPQVIFDAAFRTSSGGYISTEQNGTTLEPDDETVAAEYLRVIGDRLQAEYGNQLDALMHGLDWTLARHALLAEVRRILADLLSRISDIWTQVSFRLSHFISK